MKKILSFLLLLGILTFLISCNNSKSNTYQVIETYRITSSSGTTSFLSVELPISYGYQYIGDIEIKNVDGYYFEQKDYYQTLYADIEGDGTEKTITITYDVTLFKGKYNWSDDATDEYLLPSEFIDSDNQSIIDIAKTLIVEGDDYQTAKNISEYVSKNIEFDYSTKINEKINTASETLEVKEGVCLDYANLMTALLRVSGIPAKKISGLALKRLNESSDWSSPAGSHAWVEFYANGKWYFDDPSWGDRNFDYSDGYHLSYGTQPTYIYLKEYQSMIHEIESNGFTILGAMTAPIKYTAWSEDKNASVIPKVDITKK